MVESSYTLSKTQHVLDTHMGVSLGDREWRIFRQFNADDPTVVDVSLSFDKKDWEAMGRPAVVTVTIEPGRTI